MTGKRQGETRREKERQEVIEPETETKRVTERDEGRKVETKRER